ncbi:hypothetical protein K0U00_30355, partial [Paenibacillus sepulcri]|nr:hypothetical protein [Paenibacillus sepulcri]
AHAASLVSPLEVRLQQLLATLPAADTLAVESLPSLEEIAAAGQDKLLGDVNLLIAHIEQHLQEWTRIKTLLEQAKP